MKFEYTGRHIDVTPALRAHAEEHFQRIEHVFGGKTAKAHIILSVVRDKHNAEIVLKWRNDVITAKASSTDMYQSLSQSIDKVEKQALKSKTKVIDKSHKAAKAGRILQKTTDVSPEKRTAEIVLEKKYSVKPVTVVEASELVEKNKNGFLVFRNADNEKISVIYKRKDGDYGLIEP